MHKAKNIQVEKNGIVAMRPWIKKINRVLYKSKIFPAIRNKIAEIKPWLNIMIRLPFKPILNIVSIDQNIMVMCLTEEYAIKALISVWNKHTITLNTLPIITT
jgi:hypothetical protein